MSDQSPPEQAPDRRPPLPVRISLALAISLAAGTLAWWVGMPLPWMLGPMIGNTVASVMSVPVAGPNRLRPIVIPVIGVMLGSGISAEVLSKAGAWAGTFLFLPPFLIAAAAVSYGVYRGLGRYDPVTAFYSAMPGGLNEMLLMGAEAGGDQRKIALAHASRVLMTIFFVVMFFGLVLGVSTQGGGPRFTAVAEVGPVDALWLIGSALVGLPLARLLRLPAPPLLGPMILSGVAHLTGLVTVPPPTILVIAAQLVMGTVIGCRFQGARARDILKDLALGAGAAVGMIAVAVIFALMVHFSTGTDLAQAFLAYSPGGLTEMSLLALAMGQEIAYVSITHIARISLVIFMAPFLFRAVGGEAKE
ncbi:MAG: AbrB family transcriptional regulator [Rhodobacteraceae bacterium]|nr:AbrB family transcriptional regulator [Paracoccaceae bacterium]